MSVWYWILFIFSAIAYPIPFLCESLWWLVFFFPILFFWVALKSRLTFFHGFIWGLISWSLHLGGALYGVMLKASGAMLYVWAPLLGAIVYCALQTAIWFWVTQIIIRFCGIARYWLYGENKQDAVHALYNQKYSAKMGTIKAQQHCMGKNEGLLLIIWLCSSWCYFFVVSYWSLALFNRVEGCFMMNPLVVLAVCPQLLYFLPIFGEYFLLFLLLAVSASVVWFLKNRTMLSGVLVFIAMCPWLVSVVMYNRSIAKKVADKWSSYPAWLSKVVRVPVLFCCPTDTVVRAHQVGRELAQVQVKNPEAEIIIFPESCLYGVIDEQQFCAILHEQYIKKPLHIICGGFREQGAKWQNVFYWFYKGNVQAAFCKKHAVVLAEALPNWCKYFGITDCYFKKDMPQISVSQNSRPKLMVQLSDGQFSFIPYICSELFLNQYPDDHYGTMCDNNGSCELIIEIANDTWAVMDSTKRLMFYAARFKAIAWQRNILYVSYYYGAYINRQGVVFYL